MPSQSEVITQCESDGVRLVRLLYVGNDGVLRGQTVDAERIADVFEHGMNLPAVVQSLTATDTVASKGPFGSTDEVRLVPVAETFRMLPYAERTAAMICTITDLDSNTWGADPRGRLVSVLDSLDERGIEAQTAFESEFYLLEATDGIETQTARPVDESPYCSADGMQNIHDIVVSIVDALDAQDISFSKYHPELGPGQQEFITDHGPGLDPLEEYLLLRQTVTAVVQDHGLDATFDPKPLPNAAGSGCHIHLSLWSEGSNLFFDADADSSYALSETGRHFVGGLLQHASALVALTSASEQSYQRLQPSHWATAYACWGLDNREALVRVPSAYRGKREATTRIEFKAADNTANPYLSILGLLAAGMDGIDRAIDPGEPLDVDPAKMESDERERRGVYRLPETLEAGLEELEANDVLADALGETLLDSYLTVKRRSLHEGNASDEEYVG